MAVVQVVQNVHAHVYPEEYLKKLEASKGDVRIETDANGKKWILSRGARAGPIIPDFFDIDMRVDRIRENRVDMQILSAPHPGVDRFTPAESSLMSRTINDGIANAEKISQPLSGPRHAPADRHPVGAQGT